MVALKNTQDTFQTWGVVDVNGEPVVWSRHRNKYKQTLSKDIKVISLYAI